MDKFLNYSKSKKLNLEVRATLSDLKFISGFKNYWTNVPEYQSEARPIFERINLRDIDKIS